MHRHTPMSAVGAALVAGGFLVALVGMGTGASADQGPLVATSATVSYTCSGVGFAAGFGTLPPQDVTVTLGAPGQVTPGQAYDVTVDLSPLTLKNPGFALDAPAKIDMAVTGGTGSNASRAISSNVTFAGDIVTVPQATMTVTPTAVAGGQVSLIASKVVIVVGSTGFSCNLSNGTTPASIITGVVGSITTTTTTTTSTTTTTTLPGQTTTTTTTLPGQTTTTTTTTTTAAPTTTTTAAPTTTATPPTVATTLPPTPTAPPAGNQTAKIVTVSASAPFTCNIIDDTGSQLNQNPLPPSNVTITMTLPDKVGVGGRISGLVKMDPGPMNGPIKLNAGTVNFAAKMSASGGTPATFTASGGPNGEQIPANSPSRSPEMGFAVTASAGPGGEVALGVREVNVLASVPSKVTTVCTPQGSAMARVASVAVVEGTVTAPAALDSAAQSGSSASGSGGSSSTGSSAGSTSTGFASCDEAKAAGRGSIPQTDPAYKASLDGDGDGVACEAGDPAVLGTSLARSGSTSGDLFGAAVGLVSLGAALMLLSRRRS